MDQGGIYRIMNEVDGKSYVGSAVNLRDRWKVHLFGLRRCKHHSAYLQRAFLKYGESAFRFYVLEYVQDKTLLIKKEQFYIDALQPEYNCSKTAGSILGFNLTPESCARISAAKKGWKPSAETRARMSAARKGKRVSEKTLVSMSKSRLGKKLSPAHCAAIKAAMTAEIRSKISRSLIGNKRALKKAPQPVPGTVQNPVREESHNG